MGADDATGDSGISSKSENILNGVDMEIYIDDNDDEYMESNDLRELGEDFLTKFCRKAAASFFNEHGLISHQINSYNDFIKNGVQNLFDALGEITVEPGYDPSKKGEADWRYASVKFGKVSMDRPSFWVGEKFQEDDFQKFLPRHARLQNMTYASRVNVKITVQVYTQKLTTSDKFKTGKEQYIQKEVLNEESREILVGRLPVMVNSELCWMSEAQKGDCEFDHGGYFLIKGTEKTFIAQEQITIKRLWLSNNPNWTVAYRSEWKRKRVFIKLMDPPKDGNKSGEKVLMVYLFSLEVPLWILLFALGVSCDKEAIDLIDCHTDDTNIINVLFASIFNAEKECEGFRQEVKALNKLNELLKLCKYPPGETIEECISKYLFPYLSCNKQKAYFISYMVKCLLQAYTGKRKCDNRDDFRNKRVELAGELLERELRVHIKHAERRMAKAMQKDLYGDHNLHPIDHYFDASIITNGLTRAFSIGAWCHPFKRMERVSGVVATLRRTNPLQMTADMRKTRQQVHYTGKVGDARYPHPSHWGKVCFLSTPDGEHCGLVKNLSITGLVSLNVPEPLDDKLLDCGMEKLDDDTLVMQRGKYRVFLNGEWVGVCEDSLSLVTELRSMRRRKEVPQQVEIKRDEQQKEVRIFSDAGRILRPLIVVKNLKKVKGFKVEDYTFQSLVDKGVIELIGSEEEEDCRTAWGFKDLLVEEKGNPSSRYTHCELDVSFVLGLSCSIIPFANHDNARRVLYQSEKHSQQAIGFSSTNPNIRVDTLTHQLFYPQRPLFRTMIADSLGTPGYSLGQSGVLPKAEFFNGQNAIVSVNVHLGYNQEDSLVMNRASLERGMFRSEHIRSYKAEVDNKESSKRSEDCVNFGKVQSKFGRIDNLDDDGLPFVGANMQNGDIVIGRCAESGADHSIKLKHTEKGMVQKVVLSANDEGKNYVVVSLRQVRTPCLGDKFSSMHGQKGVLGFLESQENFPFTIQGIVPDVVINPHAFPSRQTPGQLLEAALGKGIACGGNMKYATPFSTLSVDAITDQLHRYERSLLVNPHLASSADMTCII